MFEIAVSHLNLAPSEYMEMTPSAFMIILEGARPTHVGGLSESQLERLHARREQMIADGHEVF